jgi:hypothetical protein
MVSSTEKNYFRKYIQQAFKAWFFISLPGFTVAVFPVFQH